MNDRMTTPEQRILSFARAIFTCPGNLNHQALCRPRELISLGFCLL